MESNILAVTFILFLAMTCYGGIMSIIAIASSRVADKRYIFPSISLSVLGACMVALILWASMQQ